jgi:malto-oligosyltrehalose trehalohydrolase
MMHPRVLQLIMDSLRYWVSEMHVDGFRFDLAAALARELHEVDQLGAFMDIIHQDPVLSQVKLIAEPWDLGDGGYQVGNFPVGWTEWNGKYRDVVRDYWRGEGGLIGQLAYRLTGSSDLYQHSGRRPYASINFITAHDGFTLHDLVSHNEKHNAANGEENRDGESHNRSWNCGAEGETTDPGVLQLRQRQRRNLLATLLLSQGVPMLLAGDEMGRTQRGNNNAYCQDNELSWVDWDLAGRPDNQDLLEFTRRLIELRRQHPALRRRHFFQGQRIRGAGVRDIIWLHPDASEIGDQDWQHHHARCFGLYLIGEALEEQDERGQWVKDDDFLLLLNGHHEAIHFTLPWKGNCEIVLDTALAECGELRQLSHPSYRLAGRSLVLLTQPRRAGRVAEPILRRRYFMPFGAQVLEGGRVRFRLWAPVAERVELLLQKPGAGAIARQMASRDAGWFELSSDEAAVDDLYRYRIDGSCEVPDPASRCNPDGVHGASQVIEPGRFAWTDGNWRGRPWEEAIIYQLHVGAFTAQGSFAAARERLDHLVELGVTAIQLLPVGAFAGAHGWGHDGVLPFAPATSYGHPDELKDLVQTAHHKGLMVLLDLACQHFGREGNYLSVYAPAFFAAPTTGLAGRSIDCTLAVAGEFLIHNALYWLEEYHLDGLRLDAVHAIRDDSRPDILEELAAAVRDGPGVLRQVHLVLENDDNAAHYLGPQGAGYTAQWNDDIHHCLHVLLTGEADGYYSDYAQNTVALLGRCLTSGFAYQGDPSTYRGGSPRGEPSAHLPPSCFVSFLQNHDQVGNRAFGERMSELARPEALRAAAEILLLAPSPPLLFMGEEWASPTRFPFFCDFGPDLAEAVTQGRRREFARFERFRDEQARSAIPDPCAATTFAAARLDWTQRDRPPYREWLVLYHRLLDLRRRELMPRLGAAPGGPAHCSVIRPTLLLAEWTLGDGSRYRLLANLGDTTEETPPMAGRIVYASPEALDAPGRLPPWSVRWRIGERDE